MEFAREQRRNDKLSKKRKILAKVLRLILLLSCTLEHVDENNIEENASKMIECVVN